MKLKFLLPILLVASPSCSTIHTVRTAVGVATSPVPLGDFTILDDKAMFAAETVFNIPAQAYVSANSRGLIPAPLKATLKPLMVSAGELLKLCRSAYKVGDLKSFNERYRALLALKDQALKLMPKG